MKLKKKLLFSTPGIVFALVILWMFIAAISISMRDTRIITDMWTAPFVGLANFREFFSHPWFGMIFTNSLRLGFVPIITTTVVAGIFVWFIAHMPKKWMKYAALTIIAIPAFMPAVALSGVVMDITGRFGIIGSMFGPYGSYLLNNPSWHLPIYLFIDILRHAFIPTVIGLLAWNAHKNKLISVGIALGVYALFRFAFMFTADMEISLLLQNQLNFHRAEVLDTRIFNQRFPTDWGRRVSTGYLSAMWVFRTVLQLFTAALAGVGIFFLGRKLKTADKIDQIEVAEPRKGIKIASIVGFLVLSVPIIFVIAQAFPIFSAGMWRGMWLLFNDSVVPRAILNSLLNSSMSGIIFAGTAFLLAYPLTFKTKWYPIMLLLTLVLNTNNIIGGMRFMRSIGLIDTPFAIWISLGFCVMGAFALYFAVRNKLSGANPLGAPPKFRDYAKIAWKPAVFLIFVAFVLNWGGFLNEAMYLHFRNEDLWGVGMWGRQILLFDFYHGIPPEVARNLLYTREALPFIVSIVPVAIGVTLIWLDKFRKTSILPLFTAGTRK
ncbi:MAG: hypothetical protein FWE04_07680 [Oscillospiraceae bacterium]|nr:hypothetical protein [Oscillospiraceae bacterium]